MKEMKLIDSFIHIAEKPYGDQTFVVLHKNGFTNQIKRKTIVVLEILLNQ